MNRIVTSLIHTRLGHGSGVAARSDYIFLVHVSIFVVDHTAVFARLHDVERCSCGWILRYILIIANLSFYHV